MFEIKKKERYQCNLLINGGIDLNFVQVTKRKFKNLVNAPEKLKLYSNCFLFINNRECNLFKTNLFKLPIV